MGAGVKCDHFKLEVRTHVLKHLNLDMRRCVPASDPKNGCNSPFDIVNI